MSETRQQQADSHVRLVLERGRHEAWRGLARPGRARSAAFFDCEGALAGQCESAQGGDELSGNRTSVSRKIISIYIFELVAKFPENSLELSMKFPENFPA